MSGRQRSLPYSPNPLPDYDNPEPPGFTRQHSGFRDEQQPQYMKARADYIPQVDPHHGSYTNRGFEVDQGIRRDDGQRFSSREPPIAYPYEDYLEPVPNNQVAGFGDGRGRSQRRQPADKYGNDFHYGPFGGDPHQNMNHPDFIDRNHRPSGTYEYPAGSGDSHASDDRTSVSTIDPMKASSQLRHRGTKGSSHKMWNTIRLAQAQGMFENSNLPSYGIDRTKTLSERVQQNRGPDLGRMSNREFAEMIKRDRVITQQSRTGTGLNSLRKKSLFRVRTKFHEVAGQFELWAKSLKVIEGHFGSAILSYFRFVRLLLLLNAFIAVLLFCVVTLPYLALSPDETFLNYSTAINASSNPFVGLAVDCSMNYSNYVTDKVVNSVAGDYILDILQGTGFMERTVLFYGVYFNKTLPGFTPALFLSDPFSVVYNMSLAYLLAMGTYFIVSFILIIRQSAAGVKEGLVSQESTLTQYCNKVFAGWDFCITDQSKGKLKHKNLRKELEADLNEQQMAREREARSTKQWVKLYLIRIFINICVLIILGGSLALIYLTNDWSLTLQQREEIMDQFVALLVQFLPSITITILNILVPLLFDVMVEPEGYSPAFQIKMTLSRTVLLRLASIAILMISLYGQVVDRTGISEAVDSVNAKLCKQVNGSSFVASVTCDLNSTIQTQCGNRDFSKIKCWETYVGQQLYKLIVLDFLVVLVTTFLVEFPRRLTYRKFHDKFALVKRFGKQEFDIPKNVLDIVYSQTLCWLGAFFSPLIPFMCMLKCLIFFYIKKLSLLQNCDPPEKPFRASKSNSFFMTVLLISFVMAAIPIGFMVGRIPPSQSCGPFRIYSEVNYFMFHSLTNLIETFPDIARDIFYFFGSVAFYIPAMIILCLVMYYFWAVAQGYKKMGKLLKNQLALEGKDKQYLLRQVTEAMRRGQGTT